MTDDSSNDPSTTFHQFTFEEDGLGWSDPSSPTTTTTTTTATVPDPDPPNTSKPSSFTHECVIEPIDRSLPTTQLDQSNHSDASTPTNMPTMISTATMTMTPISTRSIGTMTESIVVSTPTQPTMIPIIDLCSPVVSK